MNFLILIGLILILLTIVLPFFLQLKVTNKSCQQDIDAVKNNIIGLIVCGIAGLILTIIGLHV